MHVTGPVVVTSNDLLSETPGDAWEPLASSPVAFTAFANALGVTSLEFVDVLSLDEELLTLLPEPVLALILIFPTTSGAAAHFDELEAKATPLRETENAVLFLQQRCGGTCGTIAALHALASTESGSVVRGMLDDLDIKHASSEAARDFRSRRLLDSAIIREAHQRAVLATTTRRGLAGQRQGRHFICWVPVDGVLTLLDGRRQRIIDCGQYIAGDAGSFLRAAAVKASALMQVVTAECNSGTIDAAHAMAFSMMALVPVTCPPPE